MSKYGEPAFTETAVSRIAQFRITHVHDACWLQVLFERADRDGQSRKLDRRSVRQFNGGAPVVFSYLAGPEIVNRQLGLTLHKFDDEFIVDRGWTATSKRRWNRPAPQGCLHEWLEIEVPDRLRGSAFPIRPEAANSSKRWRRWDMDSDGRSVQIEHPKGVFPRKITFGERA